MLSIIMAIENEDKRDKAEEIYKKYYGTMMHVAMSYFPGSPATAEDAVSEAIIKIIKNLDKISEIDCHRTRGYVVIIVKSTALNMIKKRKRSREDEEELIDENVGTEDLVLDGIVSSESYGTILKVISALPEKLSAVLYLSAVMEYSNSEIAEELGISYDAVRQNLSRARREVKKKLGQMGWSDVSQPERASERGDDYGK